jgi:hypothetical protein
MAARKRDEGGAIGDPRIGVVDDDGKPDGERAIDLVHLPVLLAASGARHQVLAHVRVRSGEALAIEAGFSRRGKADEDDEVRRHLSLRCGGSADASTAPRLSWPAAGETAPPVIDGGASRCYGSKVRRIKLE